MLSLVPLVMLTAVSFVSPVNAADWRYSVRPGDTLWALCREYVERDNCWRAIADYNKIDDPQSVRPGTVLRIPYEWLVQVPVAAEVLHVAGEAWLVDSKSASSPLSAGQQLLVGARLKVAEGYLTIRFADHSTLSMYPGSELVLDAVSALKQTRPQSVKVSLPRGRVKVFVPEREPRTRFRIQTPAAVAAVRGTVFRVASDAVAGEPSTRGEVLKGAVDIARDSQRPGIGQQKETRSLSAGYGAVATKGRALSATQLLDAPRWNRECNDPGYVEWMPVDNAASYTLTLLDEDTAVERVLRSQTIQGNSHTFSQLESKCYRVQVNATDYLGLNGIENERRLCYRELPASPKIVSARHRDGKVELQWTAIDDAALYIVEASYDDAFSSTVFTQKTGDTTLQHALSDVGGGLYTRVTAVSAQGQQSPQGDVVLLEGQPDWRIPVALVSVLLLIVFL